jgi:hypothetical protein
MELGQHQLQLFISSLTIVAAAAVALICDFLKRSNEQLRELTVELKARREDEQPQPRTMTERFVSSTPRPKAVTAPKQRERAIAPEALAVLERGAQMAKLDPRAHAQGCSPAHEGGVPLPKRDWNALLSQRSPVAKPPRQVEVRRLGPNILPAGFHEGCVLGRLVQTRQAVNGLVVSIGVDSEDGSIPEPVRKLVESLIGPEDFACKSGDKEFVLIYNNMRGASAQRRLSVIAQSLWDFQLRWLGNFSVLFSWGGVEVRGEPIQEAIAAANERMLETKRLRKVVTLPSKPRALARAV